MSDTDLRKRARDGNIFEALRKDHDRHRKLIEEIEQTEGESPERHSKWSKFEDYLTAHARAEDRVLYSVILGDATSQNVAAHSIKEHQEIEKAIAAVKERDYSSPQWLVDFKALAHLVKHHEDEEEHGTFQVAGKVLSEAQKASMASDFFTALEEELHGAS